MSRALPLAAVLALACGPQHRADLRSGCGVAVGILELCGADCRSALDVVRPACAALAGVPIEACQVADQATAAGGPALPQAAHEGPAALPLPPPPAAPDMGVPPPDGGPVELGGAADPTASPSSPSSGQ